MDIDLGYIRASDGTGEAVRATVTGLRIAGATALQVDSLDNFPTKFIATVGTLNLTTGALTPGTISVFKAHQLSNEIIIDSFAPGYSDLGNTVGQIVVIKPVTLWADLVADALSALQTTTNTVVASLPQRQSDNAFDYVKSGGVWSLVSGLNGAMTALVAYQGGYRNTIAALASRTFTASKDTYVDILRNTTTNAFSLVYTEVANNAASPALAANSIRLAKVVTSGSAITSFTQMAYDSLNNQYRPMLLTGAKITHLRYELLNSYANPPGTLVLPLTSKIYDSLGEWNAATYLFEPKEFGLYQVSARELFGGSGAGSNEWAEITIRINNIQVANSERMNGSGDASRIIRPFVHSSFWMKPGDYLAVIHIGSAPVRDLSSGYQTYAEIHRIA